jgi:hyaluronan synthase
VGLRAISKTELENGEQQEVPSPGEERQQEAKRTYKNTVKELRNIWDWVLCAAILCGFAALIYLSVHTHLFQPLWTVGENHRWVRLILRPSMLWSVMGLVLLGFRTVLWFCYRPFSAASMENAPWLTVIIPAYNEGPMVLKSIESVATAHYPRDRFEIFVVDDGSTDDTWQFIRWAAARHRGFVKPIRLRENSGKRAALAVAFRKACGTVVVTLDSDSVVEPDSLLAIAGPFRDSKIGAVAGKVAVYNRQGIIPRMLHVQFILSFDLQRAVESTYGNVYCCPGALTAYRASVVQNVLDDWMEQTFLGSPCTFGEDRAMTNLILKAGYDTVYQRSAIVHTVVPMTYSKLCKMFIRWNRSYVREELRFLTIVWKRPVKTRVIALCDRIITNLRYPVHYMSLSLLALLVMHHPWMLARILVAIGLISLFNMTYYLCSERSPDFCYGVLYSYFAFVALSWIFPYAAFTVRARSWLTR